MTEQDACLDLVGLALRGMQEEQRANDALTIVEPDGWTPPRGYVNGIIVPTGRRLLVVAGQIGWDARAVLVQPSDPGEDAFVCQFAQALRNVAQVVQKAGGSVQDVISLRLYVTDKQRYMAQIKAIGAAYRSVFGRHYPTMALLQVADLLEPGAMVEIEAMAALP